MKRKHPKFLRNRTTTPFCSASDFDTFWVYVLSTSLIPFTLLVGLSRRYMLLREDSLTRDHHYAHIAHCAEMPHIPFCTLEK
ncbi:hypothetical protein BDQ12DRAFT_677960 [Crucibulum laeve]|uniref:Uncharacterized protein n=1 Tax=Crucibulum laeve TaxID=68775 RepID=A0A5C3MAD0_9AGAR|nr:hypothetical protein BDQ12DRAFT_677960 [Crucibulum laeve]